MNKEEKYSLACDFDVVLIMICLAVLTIIILLFPIALAVPIDRGYFRLFHLALAFWLFTGFIMETNSIKNFWRFYQAKKEKKK